MPVETMTGDNNVMTSQNPESQPEPSLPLNSETRDKPSFPAELVDRVNRLEKLLAHMWMVRQFLKHCDEAEDDEDLCDVQRDLYDYLHAVGVHVEEGRSDEALRFAKKKLRRLREATRLFDEIQEEVSTHTNFRMARRSLLAVLESVEALLAET